MIVYTDALEGVQAEQLKGFFVEWPNPPSAETHLRILQGSAAVVLAKEVDGQVIGFITAVSDGVLSAYIPLLEVLPAYQHQGVGGELVKRMLEKLRELYMVDLICDAEMEPFYTRFGMRPYHAMFIRNYDRQSGAALKS